MLEGGFVGYGGDDKPVEQPVPEVHPVELVAELVEIPLQERQPHAVVQSPI